MNAIKIGVRRCPGSDDAVALPEYATAGAAGLDVRANLAAANRSDGFVLAPGAWSAVSTGLALELPAGFEAQMRPRSGLALRHGVTLLNAPGTIDSDYRGEVAVILVNHGSETVVVAHGMRIAQMVIAPVIRVALVMVEELGPTARGTRGFGSTGDGLMTSWSGS